MFLSVRVQGVAVAVALLAVSALAQNPPTGAPVRLGEGVGNVAPPASSAFSPTPSIAPPAPVPASTISADGRTAAKVVRQGDTAWILTSAALVVFMVFPGISLFYGGLIRRKNVISIYAQCVVIAAATILSWITISYSLAFSPTGGAFIGDLSRVGLTGITPESLFPGGEVLEWPMVVFHLAFAIVTAALVIGSFAERVRPGGVLLFGLLWPILVYAPVARWVRHADGWLAKMPADASQKATPRFRSITPLTQKARHPAHDWGPFAEIDADE